LIIFISFVKIFIKEKKNMEEVVNVHLNEGLSFDAEVDGHSITIDTAEEFGGANRGPKPKSLMLVALAGCTGMDVASILRKMKVPFESLDIRVSGQLTETHPKHFEHMHITYMLKGEGISREKVEKAIELSQDKYCGVSFNYKTSIRITHETIID
jgi:putative redox protein